MNIRNKFWFVGLLEGEGTFIINMPFVIKSDTIEIRPSPIFSISLTDRNTVILIKKLIGFGRIGIRDFKKHYGENAALQYVYTCSGVEDCMKFVKLLPPPYLKTKKQKDYILWSKGINIIQNYGHFTYEGIVKLCEIRDSMNKKIKSKNYKSRQFFQDLFLKNPQFMNQFEKNNIQLRIKRSKSINSLGAKYLSSIREIRLLAENR